MSGYDPNNPGKRAEVSLNYIIKQPTELLVSDGSKIFPSQRFSTEYCAVEWMRARWLVMEAEHWKSLFGSRTSISLRQALVDNRVTSGRKTLDPDFRSNGDYRFDIAIAPAMLDEGTLGRLLCKRLPPRYTMPSSPPIQIALDWPCSGSAGRRPPTGNVFVEYRQRMDRASIDETWEESGLAVTQSHLWAIEWAYRCWVILPTKHLRTIANPMWVDPRQRRRGGDWDVTEKRKCAKGVLVKLVRLLTEPK